jgi:hypothetical protein
MSTIEVTISETEKTKYGIKSSNMRFDELIDLIKRDQMRQSLEKCLVLAEKYGLSEMTMEEIDEEVKAVRSEEKARKANAKDNS